MLAPERDLDLKTLERTFTLRCHDAVTTAIGPGLLAAVRAPGVGLRFMAEAATDTNDLRHGRVDLEVGSAEPALPEIRSETVGHDRLVVAVRPDHPFTHGELTVGRYAQARHVTVSRDPIDEVLEARGMRRRVVASAPTSTAALYFVRQSDLMAAVPERMCGPTVRALGLRTLPIPLGLQSVPVIHAWHQRYDGDRAHAWLRGLVREALQAVCCPDG